MKNLSLKRLAPVILTAFLLGVAAGPVYAGGRPPAPAPQPKPQPQPQPKPQESSHPTVIGTLKSDKGTTGGSSVIGTLKPSRPGEQPMIGTLKPDNPPAPQPQPKPKPQPQPQPQPQTQPDQARPQNDPPPQSRPAAQQVQSESGPQIVQEAPKTVPAAQQAQEPIIITPRSVRAGNASGGNRTQNLQGYSGGNGSGPLIYNP